MQTKIHHWTAIGRSVFDLQGGRSPTGFFNQRIAQASKDAPPETANLLALAPAMAHALSCAARGDCGPARTILQSIPPAFKACEASSLSDSPQPATNRSLPHA